MRSQFETVYLEMIEKEFSDGLVPIMQRMLDQRRHDGSYQDPTQRWMYWAWLASREAISVELPKPIPDWGTDGWGDGYKLAIERCKESIESQGLKVKS